MMKAVVRPRLIAILTILAIAGTLTSCGRYGRPVRSVPVSEPEVGRDEPVEPREVPVELYE